MSKNQIVAVVVFLSLFAGPALAEPESPRDQRTEREKFDPTRDPAKDVAAAVESASKSGQRILLDVGGEWCPWCRKLDAFFEDNRDIAAFLHKNFVVVKVNFSKENSNEKFLSQYPAIRGYPHMFVLDSDGKLLHSQSTGELEDGDHHDHDKVFAFLKKWAPTPRHA
jgi:thioredoxin-related protein